MRAVQHHCDVFRKSKIPLVIRAVSLSIDDGVRHARCYSANFMLPHHSRSQPVSRAAQITTAGWLMWLYFCCSQHAAAAFNPILFTQMVGTLWPIASIHCLFLMVIYTWCYYHACLPLSYTGPIAEQFNDVIIGRTPSDRSISLLPTQRDGW